MPRVVLNAKYDLNGNRTALNAQVNVGSGLTDDFQNLYTFDRLNRETSVIQQSKSGGYAVGYKKTTFVWYNDGRLQVLSDYKDSSTQAAQGSFTYDHVGRLTDITWSGYNGPYTIAEDEGFFDKFSWTYDYGSRAATMTSGIDANENLTYSYDNDSQLTSAVASYGGYGGGYGGYGAGYGGGTYGWDGNGDTTLSGWVTGKGNRLLKDGTYRYEYDLSGHLVKKTTITGGAYTEYGWDGRGRMISVTDKNSSNVIQQKIDLVYDAFNDLITRTVTPYSSGSPVTGSITTAHFVYDVTGSGTAVLAFDGNQSLTDRYLWGPAVDEILADERYSPSGSNVMPSAAGTVYWALTDNENSVRDWITYGSLIDHIVYDSFGQVVNHSTSSIRFAFGHNGVFYDPSSGLEYHSQPGTSIPGRWYNPATRRWMSEDPTGLAAGPDQYEYCLNSPTNGIDPKGLDVWIEGPSSGEPTGHQSICIGDPNGEYRSYSFGASGVNVRNGLSGEVYEDVDLGGTIDEDSYIYCPTFVDVQLVAAFDAMLHTEGPYRLLNLNCRVFSQAAFASIVESPLLKKGPHGEDPVGFKVAPPKRTKEFPNAQGGSSGVLTTCTRATTRPFQSTSPTSDRVTRNPVSSSSSSTTTTTTGATAATKGSIVVGAVVTTGATGTSVKTTPSGTNSKGKPVFTIVLNPSFSGDFDCEPDMKRLKEARERLRASK